MIFQGPFESRFVTLVLHLYDSLGVIDCICLTISAFVYDSNRNVRMTIPFVKDVNELSGGRAFLVYTCRQKVDFSCVYIFVEQVHRDSIVHIVADICLHDKVDRPPASCKENRYKGKEY